MVGYIGRMGGFFSSLGWEGVGLTVVGGVLGGFAHGYISDRISRYLMPGDEEPDLDTIMKADAITTAVLAVVSLLYGAYRARSLEENDMLDAVGNILGGILLYESGNALELVSQAVGKIE